MRITEPEGAPIEMVPMGECELWVRGHVGRAQALAAVADWLAEASDVYIENAPSTEEGWDVLADQWAGPIEHVWGRWLPATEDDGVDEGCTHVWRWRRTPAPGWARVTRVWEAGYYRDRCEMRAVQAQARTEAERRWPTAYVTCVGAHPWRSRRDVCVYVWWPRAGIRLDWMPWAEHRSLVWPSHDLPHTRGLVRIWLRDRMDEVGLTPAV